MTILPLGVSPRQALLALGGGLLAAASFWPLTLWPLMLVSVALLLGLLRDADAQAGRYLGLLYGIALAGGTMYWMFWIFGIFALPLLALMAAYFAVLGMLVALTRGMGAPARIALAALFATAVEWLRGDAWYLRFPWYTPAHALAAVPAWLAPARFLGAYGLSLVVWAIAAAGAFVGPRASPLFLLLPACWLLLPPEGEPDRRALLLQTEQFEGVDQLIAGPRRRSSTSPCFRSWPTCAPRNPPSAAGTARRPWRGKRLPPWYSGRSRVTTAGPRSATSPPWRGPTASCWGRFPSSARFP
jgi:hypothetical protein